MLTNFYAQYGTIEGDEFVSDGSDPILVTSYDYPSTTTSVRSPSVKEVIAVLGECVIYEHGSTSGEANIWYRPSFDRWYPPYYAVLAGNDFTCYVTSIPNSDDKLVKFGTLVEMFGEYKAKSDEDLDSRLAGLNVGGGGVDISGALEELHTTITSETVQRINAAKTEVNTAIATAKSGCNAYTDEKFEELHSGAAPSMDMTKIAEAINGVVLFDDNWDGTGNYVYDVDIPGYQSVDDFIADYDRIEVTVMSTLGGSTARKNIATTNVPTKPLGFCTNKTTKRVNFRMVFGVYESSTDGIVYLNTSVIWSKTQSSVMVSLYNAIVGEYRDSAAQSAGELTWESMEDIEGSFTITRVVGYPRLEVA